jgi:myxalamid-type polyketide synthase MxaE and MxaD
VLVGRTAVPLRASWPDVSDDRRIIAVRAIEALGARVHPVAADIADAQAVRALFQRFGTDLPNLRGIVHAAAGISAHPVVELTPRVVDETLLPKTVGTWLLHEESLRHEIDFFLLFSSTTALLGATGLGHYAAANAFLDSFAAYRGSRGLPALSINWGTWDEMRRASEGDRTAFASGGMLPMPADDALEILGGLGDPSLRQAIVASVNWSVLKPLYETRRRRPFLEAMSAGDQSPQEKQEAPAQSAAASLDALPPHARWSGLERIVRGEVARVLQLENAATIDADQGLFAMGMDSLMSVELKSRLERAVGKPLPATLTFNYPSVAALIGFLGTDILGWGLPGTPTSAATSPAPHAGETVEATEGDETEEELAAQLARKLKDLQ